MTDRSLDGGHTYVESGVHSLDVGSPSGEYLFKVNVGQYPDLFISSGSAPYTKTSLEKRELLGDEAIPSDFALLQNHPNPFNPKTEIGYQISDNGFVKLVVYDVLGREVATLVEEIQEAGYRNVEWDATDIPSGVYFYRLSTSDYVQTRRLVLLR